MHLVSQPVCENIKLSRENLGAGQTADNLVIYPILSMSFHFFFSSRCSKHSVKTSAVCKIFRFIRFEIEDVILFQCHIIRIYLFRLTRLNLSKALGCSQCFVCKKIQL